MHSTTICCASCTNLITLLWLVQEEIEINLTHLHINLGLNLCYVSHKKHKSKPTLALLKSKQSLTQLQPIN